MFLPWESMRQRLQPQQQQQAPPPGFGGFMGSLAPVQQGMDQMRQPGVMPEMMQAPEISQMPGIPPKQGISFNPAQRRMRPGAAKPGWSPDFGQMAQRVRQRQPGRMRGRGMGRRFNQEEE